MALKNRENHALVIGGSFAGLLAARVLADHFHRVTVIERDTYPPLGEHRKGVPQSRHTHGLLASGTQVLDRLFPGLLSELSAAGAVSGDIARDARWFNEGGRLARFRSGLDGVLLTRPFLEGCVRRRVLALPNVEAREGFRAQGLCVSDDRRRVTGIKGAGADIAADFVIDVSGRGSHSPEWLAALGYPKPEEERIEIALAYTTRFFRRRGEHLEGDVATVVPPTPSGKRGGVMLAQEGDRWTVTLISHFCEAPPQELDAFIEYAGTLPAPYIYEVIKDAEPIGAPETMRFPASVRHRYEKLDRFPEGYLVFGDAIASFNPIYGQGMSVAALEAVELGAALASGTDQLARRFYRRAAKVVDMAWATSVGNDLRMPETVGPRNTGTAIINWYVSKLLKAAHADPIPALAFLRVANLLAPTPSILRPAVAWRVFLGNYRSQPLGATHASEVLRNTSAKVRS
jgi:2-polyprenyl-6-methoxyphenol hydroxylase-like FAD-dependent oxidoreductase